MGVVEGDGDAETGGKVSGEVGRSRIIWGLIHCGKDPGLRLNSDEKPEKEFIFLLLFLSRGVTWMDFL